MEPRFVVYLLSDYVVVLTRLALATHQHHAHQITLCTIPITLTVGGTPVAARHVLIASDVPHASPASDAVIVSLLFDPNSPTGHRLTAGLAGAPSLTVPDARLTALLPLLAQCQLDVQLSQAFLRDLCVAALAALPLPESSIAPQDERIAAALRLIRQSPEAPLPAKQAASHVALSETRFIHLFRVQAGTTFRALLLWLRLGRALQHIWRGQSLTWAAHTAGFSDSAHLSRTGRHTFGRPLSQLFGDPASFRVYSYLDDPVEGEPLK